MEETMRIKGMVCRRCLVTVKDVFMREGFTVTKINLGEVNYHSFQEAASLAKVKAFLLSEGFEVLDDKQSLLMIQVKGLIAGQWDHSGADRAQPGNKNLSTLIGEALDTDYEALSTLFSATEGTTLEHYAIGKRIEKAQQLLLQSRLSLTDIAYQLGYSSVHHFSNQFKKTTGLSPSDFKKLKLEKNALPI